MNPLKLVTFVFLFSMVTPVLAASGDFCEYYGLPSTTGPAVTKTGIVAPNGNECTESFPVWPADMYPPESVPLTGTYPEYAGDNILELHACGLGQLLAQDKAFVTMVEIRFARSPAAAVANVLSLTATSMQGDVVLLIDTRRIQLDATATALPESAAAVVGPPAIVGRLAGDCGAGNNRSPTRIEIQPDPISMARVRIVTNGLAGSWLPVATVRGDQTGSAYAPYYMRAGALVTSSQISQGDLTLTWPQIPKGYVSPP